MNDVETEYPMLKTGCWLVAVLFVTACVSYADRLVLSVLVDPLRASLGLTDPAVGVLQGPAFTLIYVFSSLLFGRLADRRNRRLLLLGGASAWCLTTLLCGFAQGFWTLFAGRMLVGISEATLIPPAISMIADSFAPRRRGMAVGVFAMGTCIGSPLGITAGGALLAAAQSGSFRPWPLVGVLEPWRLVLVLMGIIGFVGPVLILTLSEPKRRANAEGTDMRAAVRHFTADRRLLVPLYLGMGLLSIGDYSMYAWVPATLSRRFDWPSDRVGVVFGLITAGGSVAGALGGGWISDLWARRGSTYSRLSACAVAAAAALFGAVAISGNRPGFVLLGLGLWIFASTCGGVGGIAAIQDVVPSQFRGTGVSLLTFCNTLLGLGCGPTFVALTTELVYGAPSSVGFAITTVVAPAALVSCWLFLLARGKFSAAPPAPAPIIATQHS
jgi:MFS family permease